MEKDDEAKVDGNSYSTYFRQYDPRLGRWLSIDPMSILKLWLSTYNSFSNNPMLFIDPKGNTDYFNKKGKFIGTDGYDNSVSLLVLDKKTAREIKKATKKGENISMNQNVYRGIVPAPTVVETEAMSNAWKKTVDGVSGDEKTGHEEGFISGGGVITLSQPGEPATLPELPELNEALVKHLNEKNAPPKLVVHTPPSVTYYDSKGKRGKIGLSKLKRVSKRIAKYQEKKSAK